MAWLPASGSLDHVKFLVQAWKLTEGYPGRILAGTAVSIFLKKEIMSTTRTRLGSESILASILADESFWPSEPRTLEDTGLPVSVIEMLACKRLAVVGSSSGRQLASHMCLPFQMFTDILKLLRDRQIIVHTGSAPFNDYVYTLTESGRERARVAMKTCSYVGPAPVPLSDYVLSAEAQTIRAESPRKKQLLEAFADISVNRAMFESLGPAVNSGAGLFLYGEPGNGKSTLARRITKCFGQQIWIPQTLIEDGQIIKLFDPSLHHSTQVDDENAVSTSYDRRWIKIDRPTVVVGGELTMDSLEIRHDPIGNVSEAPLQMKANCGCFLIDDFGRQRIEPTELLNRWIVPLESRFDFLTLSTGKKIQVPFEQLIIFSTNLEPSDLVDEAFLRRIPYKVHVCNPTVEEFQELFEIYAREFSCAYRPDVVDQLIGRHYDAVGRPMRRCHPRDLLGQIRNYCVYNDLPMEMRDEYFDHVVNSYFAVVINQNHGGSPARTPAESTENGQTTSSGPPASCAETAFHSDVTVKPLSTAPQTSTPPLPAANSTPATGGGDFVLPTAVSAVPTGPAPTAHPDVTPSNPAAQGAEPIAKCWERWFATTTRLRGRGPD